MKLLIHFTRRRSVITFEKKSLLHAFRPNCLHVVQNVLNTFLIGLTVYFHESITSSLDGTSYS